MLVNHVDIEVIQFSEMTIEPFFSPILDLGCIFVVILISASLFAAKEEERNYERLSNITFNLGVENILQELTSSF